MLSIAPDLLQGRLLAIDIGVELGDSGIMLEKLLSFQNAGQGTLHVFILFRTGSADAKVDEVFAVQCNGCTGGAAVSGPAILFDEIAHIGLTAVSDFSPAMLIERPG